MYHEVNRFESPYIKGSDSKKVRPPPLTEDYSNLGKTTRENMKVAIKKYWAGLTPEQRKIQSEKRRRNAKNWHEKAVAKGHIFLTEFTTKYVVKQKPQQKP
jgi:hypothetical protein